MNITAEVDKKLLKDVQKRLGSLEKKAPNAISSALNRAMTNVAANVSRKVREEYQIKAIDVKETLIKTKSSRGNLVANVRSKGNLIPLDRFKVSPKTVQPRRKKPIKVSVKKGSLKTMLGAFVADVHGIKVFQRTSKKRLPISRKFGPSIPQMLSNPEISRKINQEGQDVFLRRLDHEIDRILERGAG